MFGSKPLKLSILIFLAISLFLSGILVVNAQNTGQSSSTSQKISQVWQGIKGEYAELLSQGKNIQIREIIAGIKGEWQKEIIEMKQSIAELWRELKERTRWRKTP